jgi:imidazolonepropionase-like amidohydrolase
VTTVRDLGATATALRRFRHLYPPRPERARLVAAGPLITVPGGYPTVPFGSSTAAPILSTEDARRLAEDLLDNGADLLKLALETGTVFGRHIPVMSLAEASMLVRVAHGRGTVASAHITSVIDIDLALDAGVDDLAHMAVDRALPDETLERLVGQGVLWVPTLELWQCTGQSSMAVANLRRFVRAGGEVALGTDFEGYSCSWELGMPMTEVGLMERAGMTAMEIIVAGTRNAARACNLGRDLGTVEAGKLADLLLVRGDPLSRLSALRDVRLVMHDGVVIRDGRAAQRRGAVRRMAIRAR